MEKQAADLSLPSCKNGQNAFCCNMRRLAPQKQGLVIPFPRPVPPHPRKKKGKPIGHLENPDRCLITEALTGIILRRSNTERR